MVTDASPRKTNSAGFLESDRIKTLDLPQDGCLPKIANSIEEPMKAGKTADVRNMDADGGAQRGHILRHLSEHAVPRVLPSP